VRAPSPKNDKIVYAGSVGDPMNRLHPIVVAGSMMLFACTRPPAVGAVEVPKVVVSVPATGAPPCVAVDAEASASAPEVDAGASQRDVQAEANETVRAIEGVMERLPPPPSRTPHGTEIRPAEATIRVLRDGDPKTYYAVVPRKRL
jgi:hypothetical protein